MSPMSPRLLRPRATGFDPRSISGCVCNLDASEASSLKQNSDGTTAAAATNDPVGYVQDLSGLGNHAKQTVATGSRPLLKLNNQNGRPGLLFDGSNDFLTASIAGFKSLTAVTILQVTKPTAAAAADTNSAIFWGFGNISGASGIYPGNKCVQFGSATGLLAGELIAFNLEPPVNGRIGSSSYSRNANTAQVLATTLSGSGLALYSNSSPVSLTLTSAATSSSACSPSATGYTVDDELHIHALRSAGSMAVSPEATLHQMIVYDRVLTTAERQKVEGYLAWKWGLQATLPYDHPYAASFPGYGTQATPTDADALAYLSAVRTADGGTGVEVGVANAVDSFVKGCKSDGTWSAIKASCILAGARTLSGALVPLAGTAPTNNGFVAADYNRKTGLVGDGSTKYLDSNRAGNTDPQNSFHLGLYASTVTSANKAYIGAGGGESGASSIFEATGTTIGSRSRSSTSASVSGHNVSGFIGHSRSSSTSYTMRGGGSSSTQTTTTDGRVGQNIVVFAVRTGDGTTLGHAAARLAFYSIGESLDLALLDSRLTRLINEAQYTLNTGLSGRTYATETLAYINAGYAAGGTLA